jgi:hypothetical protein
MRSDPNISLHDWARSKKESEERANGKKPSKGNEDIGYPIPGKPAPIRPGCAFDPKANLTRFPHKSQRKCLIQRTEMSIFSPPTVGSV